MIGLADRLAAIEERIGNACARSGRPRADVTLVAVTKIFPASAIVEAHALGIRHFGENYVQEFAGKSPIVGGLQGAEFHLIGHLQSNKAKLGSDLFSTIQTVDSAKLARRLNDAGKRLNVMVEVKLSHEDAKAGVAPDQLLEVLETIRACPLLTLRGLMTMPPWSDDAEMSRPYFRRLSELARQHSLPDLSMGMSHDFDAAIEEGATHIRVGTALFGRRQKT